MFMDMCRSLYCDVARAWFFVYNAILQLQIGSEKAGGWSRRLRGRTLYGSTYYYVTM